MSDEKSNNKVIKFLAWPLVYVSLLLFFILFTEPPQSNFGISLVPLILLWLFVYSTLKGALAFIPSKDKKLSISMVSSSVASAVVLAVMFSALGELKAFDVLLLIALVVLGVFYFSRTWPK